MKNKWSVLGKLYGLTQDQIDRIQGTGKYAPVYYGGGDSGGSGGSRNPSNSGYYSGWKNQTLQNMANAGIAMYEANKTTSGGSSKANVSFQNGKKYVK